MNHRFCVETTESFLERRWGDPQSRQGAAQSVCGTLLTEFSPRAMDEEGILAVFSYQDVKRAMAMDAQPKGLAEVCFACLAAMQ